MQDKMRGRVVVVAGASSGIGRATATAFARRGAVLVLAARRGDLLEEVAAECRSLGGQASAVPTDVTDMDAVTRLAEAAIERHGCIDVWVANAGTGVVGPFQDGDILLHKRTIETNLFGAMHGAAAVLPIFLRQGRGVLINMISMGGWAPTPFAASYSASKFGLRGFTASLRQELARHRHIHVCGIFPAIVDTPGFAHGANVTGRTLNPGPMLYAPEEVAEAVVSTALRPRDEVVVGWPSTLARIAYGIMPGLVERMAGRALGGALAIAKPGPNTEGAVLEPVQAGREASGGWRERRRFPRSAHDVNMLLAAGGVTLLALGAMMAGRRAPRHIPRLKRDFARKLRG